MFYHLVGILWCGIPHPIVDDLMTSVPGVREMRFDALPGSPLPGQLAELGYTVTRTGETQRILAHAASIAVVEQFDVRMP